jgi:hypothetical protein
LGGGWVSGKKSTHNQEMDRAQIPDPRGSIASLRRLSDGEEEEKEDG